jgi:hypothetical protein
MQRVDCALVIVATSAIAQSGLRINEFGTGTPDYCEITNLGPDIVYMGGYKVNWGFNPAVGPFQSGAFTFPAGTVLYPGGSAILTDTVNASTPSAPLGTLKLYIGVNLPWLTAPMGNGLIALADPASVGLDRVQWGANTANFDSISFGETFTGVVNMTSAAGQRKDNNDTDLPADWFSSVAGSPGSMTPPSFSAPGQTLIVGLTHVMTAAGGGQFSLTITSQNPPLPGVEVYNLLSLIDHTPNGSGAVFGVGTDVISLALTPAFIGNPFHTFLDGAGVFAISVPAGVLPPGLKFEGVALTVVGGLVSRISTVSEVVL